MGESRPQENQLQSAIAMTKKVRSTKDILKELVSMFYTVDKNVPGFASIVVSDINAARLRKEADDIRSDELAKGLNNLNVVISRMTASTTYGDTHNKTITPTINQTRQTELEIDKTKLDILAYIEKQHSKIPLIIEKINQGNIDTVPREIIELLNEGKSLLAKTQKLGLETIKLQEKQEKIFRDMFNLLPPDSRKNLGVSVPTTEKPTPQAE